MTRTIACVILPVVACMLVTGAADAVDVYLRAEAITVNMPDPAGGPDIPIAMWGLARDDSFEGTELQAASVPGPQITVPSGDTTLTIHLDNNLSVPISLVVPGQLTTMTPVFMADPDGTGRPRVQSFTHETPAGNTTDVTYTWSGLKPGTFLYHSGTHPQVQVQMGLYGALVVNSATDNRAYDNAASDYDEQVVLLYSEIDPVLHAAVDGGTYVSFGDPSSQMTSTVDYKPTYFLINGQPFTSATLPVPAGYAGDRILLRVLNAGLRLHAPTLLNGYMNVIAEDGNLLPFVRRHYALGLPPGQTKDAIWTPSSTGDYPLYDRSMGLSNAGGLSAGGMLRILQVRNLIAADGFESGNGSGGTGWAGPWTLSGNALVVPLVNAHSGIYHLTLLGSSASPGSAARTVDLTGATDVRLRFWAMVSDFEIGDTADVKVSPDGLTFTTVATFDSTVSDGQYHAYDIDLSSFAMTSSFQIVFESNADQLLDRWLLDDISVVGAAGP